MRERYVGEPSKVTPRYSSPLQFALHRLAKQRHFEAACMHNTVSRHFLQIIFLLFFPLLFGKTKGILSCDSPFFPHVIWRFGRRSDIRCVIGFDRWWRKIERGEGGSGQEAFRFFPFFPARVKGCKENVGRVPNGPGAKQTLQQLVSHRDFKLYIKTSLFQLKFDKFCIEKRLEGKSDEHKIASLAVSSPPSVERAN